MGTVRKIVGTADLAVYAGLVWGCPERALVQPVPSVPDGLQWRVGDSFTFDTWSLDQDSCCVPSSHSLSVRRVLQTGAAMQEFRGVTVMFDSIAIPGTPPVLTHATSTSQRMGTSGSTGCWRRSCAGTPARMND